MVSLNKPQLAHAAKLIAESTDKILKRIGSGLKAEANSVQCVIMALLYDGDVEVLVIGAASWADVLAAIELIRRTTMKHLREDIEERMKEVDAPDA